MKPTEALHELGQSLWLDNITRGMLDAGAIQRYIDDYSVTGLTSNPSIFDHAISTGGYDEAIRGASRDGLSSEDLFFELAIDDLRRAADLFLPVHERTDGVDGWVSLEVSPLLAYDTDRTVAAAKELHARAGRRNLFIKIPGTAEGLAGHRGGDRRGHPGQRDAPLLGRPVRRGGRRLPPRASSGGWQQASTRWSDPSRRSSCPDGMSPWKDAVPAELRNGLGLAVGLDVYRAYRSLLESDRFEALANAGARAQRLLWASTKTKDATADDTLYVHGLAAPFTVNTMPDDTLEAFFDHGTIGDPLPHDGAAAAERLAAYNAAGVDTAGLAAKLQGEGATAFVNSWNDLIAKIDAQRATLT